MRTKDYQNRWLVCYASYLPSGCVKFYPLAFVNQPHKGFISAMDRKENFPQNGAIFVPSFLSERVTQGAPILKVIFRDLKNSRQQDSSEKLIALLKTTDVKQYDFNDLYLCLSLKETKVSQLLKDLDISICPLDLSCARNRLYVRCDDGVVGPFDIIINNDDENKKRVLLNGDTGLLCQVKEYREKDLSILPVCSADGWELSLLSAKSISQARSLNEYSCVRDEMLQEAFLRCLDIYVAKNKTPIAFNVRVTRGIIQEIIQYDNCLRLVPFYQERILSLLDKVTGYGELLEALKNYLLSNPRLSSELVRIISETYPHSLDSFFTDTNVISRSSASLELGELQTKKKQLENEIHVLEQTKAEKEKEADEVADKLKSVIQAHMAQLQTKIEEYKTVAGGFAMRVDQKLFSHIQSLVSSVNNAEDIQSGGAADNVEDVAEYEHTEDKSLPLVQFRADLQNSSLGNEIIRRVVGYMAAKKRHCSVVEVTNYLICMTQGFMTTFAGNPGSGKTSLCNLLASALGLVAEHDGKHFVDVPVCRGWTSAKDFIGYYNPLAKQMVYSNAAVYKALDLSQKEDSSTAPPMVILLDEANLSPLEHYWSSFLKNSDFSSSATRTFSLGGENVWTISPHLRFLATVNHDHTTEELSPRFLDRSWVILLDGQSSEVDNSDINIPDISGEWAAIPYAKLEEAFGAMTHEGVLMNPEVKTLWDNICSVMQSFQMRIMPRNVNMVENYVKTASLYMSDTFAPLDYAIAQKILPTLSGSGERMKDCLIQLRHLCDGKLPRTKALLVRMLEAGKQNMEMYQFFIS